MFLFDFNRIWVCVPEVWYSSFFSCGGSSQCFGFTRASVVVRNSLFVAGLRGENESYSEPLNGVEKNGWRRRRVHAIDSRRLSIKAKGKNQRDTIYLNNITDNGNKESFVLLRLLKKDTTAMRFQHGSS